MRHLLVTNDFPPKAGGIQNLLWELWRRLPPSDVTVLTTPYAGSAAWDRAQSFRVERTREPVLLPIPGLARRIDALADEVGAGAVLLDPALPLGAVGPRLDSSRPYGLVLHGAEVTVPGRLPLIRRQLARVLSGASLLIAAGGYPEAEARRAVTAYGPDARGLPAVVRIPPGVDVERFRPLDPEQDAQRARLRRRFDLDPDRPLVVSVSRLVPRKGMDVLIDAAARLARRVGDGWPAPMVVIAGTGRDRSRLQRRIDRTGAPVRLLGFVPDDDLPSLYAAADVSVLCCRSRWMGLEQEGFGIVLLEAAAAGVPVVAGRSGGAAEAVADGTTGVVLDDPTDVEALAGALRTLVEDPDRARALGRAGRVRAETEFAYDRLAATLGSAIDRLGDTGV